MIVTLETCMTVSYKVKHTLCDPTTRILAVPQRNKTLCSHKNLHRNDYSSYSHHKLETIQTSSSGCISIHPSYSEIKKDKLLIHPATWRNLKSIILSERRLHVVWSHLHDILEKISNCQGLEWGGVYEDRQREWLEVTKLFHILTITVVTWI